MLKREREKSLKFSQDMIKTKKKKVFQVLDESCISSLILAIFHLLIDLHVVDLYIQFVITNLVKNYKKSCSFSLQMKNSLHRVKFRILFA